MTASGEGWGRTDSSRAESTICSDVVCLLSGLAGSVGESCRVSCLGHKHENTDSGCLVNWSSWVKFGCDFNLEFFYHEVYFQL